jgi:hypothetical protein
LKNGETEDVKRIQKGLFQTFTRGSSLQTSLMGFQ